MTAWLSRLKNEKSGATHATKPAKPQSEDFEVGFAGSVATLHAPCDKFCWEQRHQLAQAANDALATVTDADRWGWPHSPAMDTREIEVFMARVVRFTERGVSHDDAELVANMLVISDRQQDERRYCLECVCLRGFDLWRCDNWERAQVPREGIPRDFLMLPQRCSGFR